MQHETGLLLDGEARDEVGRAGFDGQAPVLVGVELRVYVEIAEPKAVERERAFLSGFNDRLLGGARERSDESEKEGEIFHGL